MPKHISADRNGVTSTVLASAAVVFALAGGSAAAGPVGGPLSGELVISSSTYVPNTGEQASLTVGSPILVDGTSVGANAVATAANLSVFTNSKPDGNFGITAPLTLSIVPSNIGGTSAAAVAGSGFQLPTNQIVTSFPS